MKEFVGKEKENVEEVLRWEERLKRAKLERIFR